jgi:hypothetical protein
MAMWGVLAMDILQGEPHFFFAGELFGGAIEAWLAAPLFWLLGPSRLVLCLVPFAFSLGLVWQVWRLARREMNGLAALSALAWAACAPWLLLALGVKPLGAYIEVPFFTLVCFGLTLGLSRPPGGEARGRPGWNALGLGLVMGLGLWTHLLMIPAIAACGLYLLLRRPRAIFSRLGLLLLAGFLLGGLPLWLISLPAGLLRPEVLGEGRPLLLGEAWSHFWAEGLPQALGLPRPRNLRETWAWWRLAVWCLYGVVALAALWPARRGESPRPRPRGGLLPGGLLPLVWLYLACYVIAWLFSGTYNNNTWRHLTPLYAGLPFVFGAGIAGLQQQSRALALAAAVLALGLNFWGGLFHAPLLSDSTRQIYEEHLQDRRELFAWLQKAGHRHSYAQGFWEALPLTLDAAGQMTFADQVENHLPRLLRQADADDRPSYVAGNRTTDLKNTLRAAHIAYNRDHLRGFHVYSKFRTTWPGLREVDPRLWSSPQSGAAEAWDRDLATGWTLAKPQSPGQTLEIDLGREEQGLCLVTLMPGAYIQAAVGLKAQLSLDGQNWTTVSNQNGFAYAPLFWSLDRPLVRFAPARQQLAFAPQAARFLRLVQTGEAGGRAWSVGEVFLFQADGPPRTTPQARELAQAARDASPQGPVFAPPEVLALLPEDMAGFRDPQRPVADSFPLEKLRIPLGPGTLLCLPLTNWPASREILGRRLARAPRVVEMGDHVLVSGLEPAPSPSRIVDPPATARLSASHSPDQARLALDGLTATRWDTGYHQEPGQELTLDLGDDLEICGLALETGPWPRDRPRDLKVLVSRDGRDWREPEGLELVDPGVVWAGDRVLSGSGTMLARFAPRKVRQARLVQTGHHPHQFWSVAELRLLVPAR